MKKIKLLWCRFLFCFAQLVLQFALKSKVSIFVFLLHSDFVIVVVVVVVVAAVRFCSYFLSFV